MIRTGGGEPGFPIPGRVAGLVGWEAGSDTAGDLADPWLRRGKLGARPPVPAEPGRGQLTRSHARSHRSAVGLPTRPATRTRPANTPPNPPTERVMPPCPCPALDATYSQLANEASGCPGRASPCGSGCDHRRHTGARLILAGRALRVPVAPAPGGPSRSTAACGWPRAPAHRRIPSRGRDHLGRVGLPLMAP